MERGEGSGRARAQSGILETTYPHVGSEVTMSDVSGLKWGEVTC